MKTHELLFFQNYSFAIKIMNECLPINLNFRVHYRNRCKSAHTCDAHAYTFTPLHGDVHFSFTQQISSIVNKVFPLNSSIHVLFVEYMIVKWYRKFTYTEYYRNALKKELSLLIPRCICTCRRANGTAYSKIWNLSRWRIYHR